MLALIVVNMFQGNCTLIVMKCLSLLLTVVDKPQPLKDVQVFFSSMVCFVGAFK